VASVLPNAKDIASNSASVSHMVGPMLSKCIYINICCTTFMEVTDKVADLLQYLLGPLSTTNDECQLQGDTSGTTLGFRSQDNLLLFGKLDTTDKTHRDVGHVALRDPAVGASSHFVSSNVAVHSVLFINPRRQSFAVCRSSHILIACREILFSISSEPL
jgi:hypothetical protein